MPPASENEFRELLQENTVLLRENHEMLKKLHRNSMIELWLRVAWYAVLVGLPFALYFYIVEPYFRALGGGSFDQLRAGISTLPGAKFFEMLLKTPQ